MTSRVNILKNKIRNKLKIKPIIDFRTKAFKNPRYYPNLPSLIGVGLVPDDAFYFSEGFLKNTGKAIGLKPKENSLLQTMRWFERKSSIPSKTPVTKWLNKNVRLSHAPNPQFKDTLSFMNKFEKTPFIDTPIPKLRKKIWNLRVRGV